MWFISEATSEDKDALSESEPPHHKTNKWPLCPAKTQISLGAQWVAEDPMFLHADSEDSDQTGRMHRLICVFAGRNGHFVGFVWRRLMYTLQLSP